MPIVQVSVFTIYWHEYYFVLPILTYYINVTCLFFLGSKVHFNFGLFVLPIVHHFSLLCCCSVSSCKPLCNFPFISCYRRRAALCSSLLCSTKRCVRCGEKDKRCVASCERSIILSAVMLLLLSSGSAAHKLLILGEFWEMEKLLFHTARTVHTHGRSHRAQHCSLILSLEA